MQTEGKNEGGLEMRLHTGSALLLNWLRKVCTILLSKEGRKGIFDHNSCQTGRCINCVEDSLILALFPSPTKLSTLADLFACCPIEGVRVIYFVAPARAVLALCHQSLYWQCGAMITWQDTTKWLGYTIQCDETRFNSPKILPFYKERLAHKTCGGDRSSTKLMVSD